jgi:shikimate dehydrogenase
LIDIDGLTEIYGVIGHPIAHTASPAMHDAAFAALGLNARYVAFDVAPEAVGDAVRGMRALGVRGLNVTVPHKQAVMPFLDEIADDAAIIDAVNVIHNTDGRLVGHNTDAVGLLRSLEEAGMGMKGADVALLGAGGAARAVVRAARLARARSVTIINRTLSKAEALAAAFSSDAMPVSAPGPGNPAFDSGVKNAKIIVNATSLGMMESDAAPLNFELLDTGHCVIDIIYNPWETALLRAARESGARTLNGFGMLVHQAAESFHIWTGRPAPIEAMRRAGEKFIRK